MTTPRILFDTRWRGTQGIARFGNEVFKRLPGAEALQNGLRLFHPLDPLRLSWMLRQNRPDIYFSPGFNPPWRTATPFVFVIHDLNYIDCRAGSNAGRRAYFRVIVRPACRRAMRVLTVSEYSRQRIVDWASLPEAKVVNVGNGVGVEFRPDGPKLEPGFPYLLYVGNRLPHKNLERLLEAFATAKLDCKLMLTGEPDNRLLRIAVRLNVSGALQFAGGMPDTELTALIRGARAVVLPSLAEGFGLPMVEAMACGVPVLASNATALPEIAGDAALLVDPKSIDDMAEGLRRIVSDDSARAELIARGLKRATLYTWDKTTAAVRAVLSEVV